VQFKKCIQLDPHSPTFHHGLYGDNFTFYPGFSELHLSSVSPVAKTWTVIMETHQVSELFVSNLNLVQLDIQGDF
jgi:hypothetical protein